MNKKLTRLIIIKFDETDNKKTMIQDFRAILNFTSMLRNVTFTREIEIVKNRE